MNIIKTLLILFVLTPFCLSEGDYSFKNISVEDGLAESTVKVIHESKQGFILFGTENGLDIFDGYRFKNYHMDSFNDQSILGNKVSAIYEANSNLIWVGTELGISVFNPQNQKFSRPGSQSGLNNYNIVNTEKIVEDINGNIWIKESGEGRLFKYDISNLTFECITCHDENSLFNQIINVMYKSFDRTLWFGTNKGLYLFDSTSSNIKPAEDIYDIDLLKPYQVTAIENGEKSALWVGTKKGLLQIDNLKKKNTVLFKKSKNKISIVSDIINDIDWDNHKKELWISTVDGISKYSPKENIFSNIQVGPFANSIIENDVTEILIAEKSETLWFKTRNRPGINSFKSTYNDFDGPDTSIMHFEHDPIDPFSIADNDITSFIEDRAGHVWIGTRQNGVSFYSFLKPKFSLLKYDQENEWGLKSNKIYSIATDSYGMMWVASGYGLENISSDGIRDFDFDKSFIQANHVMDLEFIKDQYLWAATENGILRIDVLSEEIVRFSKEEDFESGRMLHDNFIRDILITKEGMLWAGTKSGITIIDTLSMSSISFNSELTARVLFQDSDSNIWIGTDFNGLYMAPAEMSVELSKSNNFEVEGHIFDSEYSDGLSSSQITSITQDTSGVLWIGTASGLNKYIEDDDTFVHYFIKDGLPSNYITGIVVDGNNNLWISSKNGISFFNQINSSFINYGVSDGIGNIDFHQHSFADSDDGNIYFGGPKGITKVNPSDLKYNEYQPPCIITKIRKTHFDDTITEIFPIKDISKKKEKIRIDHRVKSFIIDFVALNYHKTLKNKYRYKLEPFDSEWVMSDNIKFAPYNNLGRGDYSFIVQGSNDDGLWSESSVLDFKFVPHPLLSYLALTIYSIFTIFGIYWLVKQRMQKQQSEVEEKRRMEELEQAREFQMSLIPQDPPSFKGFEFALHMKTSTEVGGDYYDFFPQDNGALYVVCGDATGHGLNAGMMVSITKAGLFGSDFNDPGSTTTRLNQTIKAINLGTTRMSLNMAKFSNGSFDFTSAGMPPAYLYKSDKKTVDEILIPGLPLGSMKNATFDLEKFDFNINDALILISDGLPECVNHDDEMLDYLAVKNCIEKNGHKTANGIKESLIKLGDDWMDGLMNDDDITLVVIKKIDE